MDGMSERDYSSHSGLSRGAIKKARKAGRLVVFGDGSINAAASDARRSEMTDPDQQRRSTSGGDSGFSGPADSSSYLKARTALTVYQAQERQLAPKTRCRRHPCFGAADPGRSCPTAARLTPPH